MSSVAELSDMLTKIIGKNDDVQSVTQFLDTGFPPLNKIISGDYNGGLPYGRIVEMFGESSTGKTALATDWMIRAQQAGGVAIFIDWERSFDVDMAVSMGLTTEMPYWIYRRPETWESGNMLASKACQAIREKKIIPAEAPIICVFDSLAAALPKSASDKEIDELTMNDSSALARVTSTTLKSQAHHAANFNAIFLYLNQVREAIGVIYGDKTKTPGGKSMEFYATARLSLTRQKLMEQVDGEKEFVGQQINITCKKTKLTRPFQHCSMKLAFEDDGMAKFDIGSSLLDYLVAEGKIKQTGPRIEWTDSKSYFKKALVEKINSENLIGELKALL